MDPEAPVRTHPVHAFTARLHERLDDLATTRSACAQGITTRRTTRPTTCATAPRARSPSLAIANSVARMDAMEFRFSGSVIEWRAPSPYHFVPVPDEECADIHEVAAMATYGWGVIPVEA